MQLPTYHMQSRAALHTRRLNFIFAIFPNSTLHWRKGRIRQLQGWIKNPNVLNIASGSEANMTTSCEMEFFNFMWLIWDHYIPLAPT